MFEDIIGRLKNFITSRATVMTVLVIVLAGILLYRCFDLQIIQGAAYLEAFVLKTEKTIEISSSRGSILDRNGNVLAYDELAYSVQIEDVYDTGLKTSVKNELMNENIYKLIKLIEKNGDSVNTDFDIVLDEDDNYQFDVSGTSLLRFLADIYGHTLIADLEEDERSASADDVIEYLGNRYGIGEYEVEGDTKSTFLVGEGYTKTELLQMITIRYAMSLTSYRKYVGTTVATDVSAETVAAILENSDDLDGVTIEEEYVRRYVDSVYFAHILGYTGKISSTELETLNEQDLEEGGDGERYDINDVVGKSGIESYMETTLQGTKGSQTVVVDNTGKTLQVKDTTEASAGQDVYLTIDADLQIAAYEILEQHLAGIISDKIVNAKTYSASSSADIMIPIYDVYYAMFNNSILDIDHFAEEDAGEKEQEVYAKFLEYREDVYETLREELTQTRTPYEDLSTEYQVYQSNIVTLLYNSGVIDTDKVDTSNATYIAWTTDETISLSEYLEFCISESWLDVSKLSLDEKYVDSGETFDQLVEYIIQLVDNSTDFQKKFYKYMLLNDVITGKDVCILLCEQDAVEIDPEDEEKLYAGTLSAYNFMMNRINNLDITPAQLALDPCNGSIVIVDVNTGDVLACVTYPGYDNNMMANSVDAEYYAALQSDKSNPMLNYATQYKSAPGSTFKMVSATAGLMEGVITLSETINCVGTFTEITPSPKCWRTVGHGPLNVAEAITNSCNYFFYEVGYRLSTLNGTYDADAGLTTLAYYADLYGLSEKSGLEISEYSPDVSDQDPVRSAIGQGSNSYTAAGLARYVTAVANSGTVYNLTLLDKVTDTEGNIVEAFEAEVRNTIEMPDAYWEAIHEGMRGVVESKTYFDDLAVEVAGKTGTAQQSSSRPNHALFVGYAPYDEPEIAFCVRIPYGYSSDYAAQVARDIIKYYYGLAEEDEIITGTANEDNDGVSTNEF